jgi:CRISPR system Cascade subunit CasD
MLEYLDAALRRPVYAPYLGRRSCPPDQPIRLGIWEGSLEKVLRSLPLQTSPTRRGTTTDGYEMVIEDSDGDRELIDQVRSFDPVYRSYGRRRVRYVAIKAAELSIPDADLGDPMALLDEEV